MRKIPTLFVRDANDRKHVTSEVTPGCEWVIAGEGVATRKFDGTCCLVYNGALFKRYELRHQKVGDTWDESAHPNIPDYWMRADDIDPVTGKQPGWVPVGDGPDDKYHREAWKSALLTAQVEESVSFPPPDGTYELVGPKVQGNPEEYSGHCLINHDTETAFDEGVSPPRDFEGLWDWLIDNSYEGIVWHHPDGRRAKLKRRDFPKP